MNDIFESLPHEKKKRIIDACVEEFAQNGYEKASTNSIVKNAGISKGTLFNYFGSKKDLFLYIFDYSIEYLIGKFNTVKAEQPADLFERLVWLSVYKMRMFLEEPLLARLVVSAVTNMPEELKENITKRYTDLSAQYTPPALEGIDTSKFRDGVDPKKAVELVAIFLEGLSNRYLKICKDRPADEIISSMDKIIKEWNEYLEILKYGMYTSRPV